ncbi:hypothetical protein DFH05DRAFT_926331 [Lentinula detonsa]|uniref:DUF6534 domain-containing protein n=1 Tax=Lentinula detonsa TaxID=2804962 RepID=A0A9W8TZE5_9AGAR|nr:hypothetical protein DFH05DRAFT_926331 [Lentinula detonsa]
MLCDTVQQALIMHIVYTYLVTYFGNVLQLQNVVWSVKAGVLLTNLTAALVQGFLVYRIWKLSNGNRWIVTPVLFLMMAEIVSVFVFGVSSFVHNGTFIEIETTLEIVCVVNTGALSSLAAIASSILILSAHSTLLYLGIFFCIGKLYTNSLLANLNIRTIIHKEELQGTYCNNSYSWPVLPQTNTTSLSNSPTGTTQDSMPASVIDHCE